jgi:microcystin-dependent protein
MNDTETIAIILCVIVIILLIFKYYNDTNKSKNHFTTEQDEYKTEILSQLNYDISSIRNLAQLANNSYINEKLYIPIDTVSPKTIRISELMIEEKLIINKQSGDDTPIRFTNINNDLNYYDLFYKGMIIPWAYNKANIPANWGLCNGDTYYYDMYANKYLNLTTITSESMKATNRQKSKPDHPLVTTPDLRGKFILHENSTTDYNNDETNTPLNFGTDEDGKEHIDTHPLGIHNINESGGEEKHTLTFSELPSHFHTVNLYMNYNYNTDDTIKKSGLVKYDNYAISRTDFESEKNKTSTPSTPSTPWHSKAHSILLSPISISDDAKIKSWKQYGTLKQCCTADGSVYKWDYLITRDNLAQLNGNNVDKPDQTAHENMPPWYALYYIMKLC